MFVPSKVLPPEMRIPGADTHLYRIGVQMSPTGAVHRKACFHPIVVFIVLLQLLIRNILFIALPEQSVWFYAVMGDIGYFMGLRIHCNIVMALVFIQAICFQMISYWNTVQGIIPIDLRVFQVMSGAIAPQTIGLNLAVNIVPLTSFQSISEPASQPMTCDA